MLPLFFSIAMLSFFIDPHLDSKDILVKQLFAENSVLYIDQPVRILTHLSDLLIYLSITFMHEIVCLIVTSFFFYHIHQLPKSLIIRAYIHVAIMTFILLICTYFIHLYTNNLMLIQLGYKLICILLRFADCSCVVGYRWRQHC